MSNKRHIDRLRKGIDNWNAWRKRSQRSLDLISADLRGMSLSGAHLDNIDLSDADLDGAVLKNAFLAGATLSQLSAREADFTQANLDQSMIMESDFREATLDGATLVLVYALSTDFSSASFIGADLSLMVLDDLKLAGANFSEAMLQGTVFANVDLSKSVGLETCWHEGPSVIDHLTLKKSGLLPLTFLRGIGLPESLIEYLPSLLNQAVQHYSCFISYSTKDQDLADRLHSDLQNKGVRCWFAPQDMRISKKILDEIDSAIRLHDKVLLILSEHSIRSDWVEDEVTKAFEEERKRGQTVLFPIRLDDAVIETNEAWAAKLRGRHIGDFTRWKEHNQYMKSFERVLRDLTVKKEP